MSILSLGIDPGFASVGIAALERTADGTLRSRGVRVVTTSKNKNKQFTNLRVSMDDLRRLREYHTHITQALGALRPTVVAIETYTVFEHVDANKLKTAAQALLGLIPQGTPLEALTALATDRLLGKSFLERLAALAEATQAELRGSIGLGAAAKTIATYGMAASAAFSFGVPVFAFQPADIKKPFGGRPGASKEEVMEGVMNQVQGLREQLQEKVPQKGLQNHCCDAAAHAVLGLREYVQLGLDIQPQIGA